MNTLPLPSPISTSAPRPPIRLSLPQTAITIENGKRIPLTPGMSVAAEIKTGTRAPIDYILAPLKKYGAESGRER